MSREDLASILDEKTFTAFVLTTVDGFALPVTDPHKALLGLSIIVVAHADGQRRFLEKRSRTLNFTKFMCPITLDSNSEN